MPTRKRNRPTTIHPELPTPDPQEGVNPRLPDDAAAANDEHVESAEEQQKRESEVALDKAATRQPPD